MVLSCKEKIRTIFINNIESVCSTTSPDMEYIPILIHFWDAPKIRLLITKTWKKCRFWLSKPYPCFTPMVWIKLGAPLGDGRFHRPLHGHFQLGGELLPLLLPGDGTIGGLAIWKLLKTTHWRTDYFLPSPPTDILFWHCIWHSIWHTFWHTIWQSIWHISCHSIWHSI